MERVMGASPFVGGERGSSLTASDFRIVAGAGKKEERGNSKTRGEKSAGAGET